VGSTMEIKHVLSALANLTTTVLRHKFSFYPTPDVTQIKK